MTSRVLDSLAFDFYWRTVFGSRHSPAGTEVSRHRQAGHLVPDGRRAYASLRPAPTMS